jgi:hypothetical protein
MLKAVNTVQHVGSRQQAVAWFPVAMLLFPIRLFPGCKLSYRLLPFLSFASKQNLTVGWSVKGQCHQIRMALKWGSLKVLVRT